MFSAMAIGLVPFPPTAHAEWGGVGGILGPETPPALNPSSSDLDGDGMPNTWEDANFLNKNSAKDASSDFDQDGLTALKEYELSQQTAGLFGKPNGKWTVAALPRPTGFTTANPSVTLLECANNGTVLARV
ncbi:hypothetical protein GCM10023212_32540 [Luteolibacter yonseiensis]